MVAQQADSASRLDLHASTVDIDGKGILIKGPSGSGKSALALQLLALGAQLVADDRTLLLRQGDGVRATVPAPIAGLIEARGVGLLRAEPRTETRISLVIDMAMIETDRLPIHRTTNLLGVEIPTLRKIDAAYFPAAILRYVKGGIRETS